MNKTSHQPTSNQPKKIKRLRILISAYACEPGKGSEPGVGWNFSKEMAKYHDLWVLTRLNNRKIIENELLENPTEGLHFIYHDLPKWAAWWKKGGRGVQLYYYLWQLTAISKIRKNHKEVGFDISHHVTFVKYWAPSCLAWLDIPFLWGPVGGGESLPQGFSSECSLKGRIYELLRSLARFFGEFDPTVRFTAKRASKCLFTTKQSSQRLKKIGVQASEQLFESGFSYTDLNKLSYLRFPGSPPIRFISVGRLLDWKGFNLGLRAFAEAAIPDAQYWIVGDGPARKSLERQVKKLGIEKSVKFWGLVDRSMVLDLLGQSHGLIHPSLHDSGGWVCLEAMAAGRPVICLDWGGPGFQVNEETGFKVYPISPDQVVSEMANAMKTLEKNPYLINLKSKAARVRVSNEFTWSVKIKKLNALYHQLAD